MLELTTYPPHLPHIFQYYHRRKPNSTILKILQRHKWCFSHCFIWSHLLPLKAPALKKLKPLRSQKWDFVNCPISFIGKDYPFSSPKRSLEAANLCAIAKLNPWYLSTSIIPKSENSISLVNLAESYGSDMSKN